MTFALEVHAGVNRGARYALHEGSNALGRDPGAAIQLLDEKASRSHARIVLQGTSLTLVDLGSSNGTALNGLVLSAEEAFPLRVGDTIAIGATRLVVARGDPSARDPLRSTILDSRPLVGSARPAAQDQAGSVEGALAVVRALGEPGGLEGALRAGVEQGGGERAALFVLEGDPPTSRALVATGPVAEPAFDSVPGAGSLLRTEPPGGGTGLALLLPVGSTWIALVVEGGALREDRWLAAGLALAPAAAAAARVETLERDLAQARLAIGRGVELVAESQGMQAVLQQAAKAALSDVPVLLQGESGTGKELLARAIHLASRRARGPFVAVNAAALPEGLVESELFGHERGAFTGAVARRAGLLRAAHGGTLFLDEVAELSPAVQPKLLRALEEGEVLPLGATQPQRVDVRLVAASHADLKQRVDEGSFRGDLYFRLAVVTLSLPPLRERAADLAPLARHLLAGLARGSQPELAADALEALGRYPFPGNVRELRNLLERALLLGDGQTVRAEDLPPEVRALGERAQAGVKSLAETEREQLLAALDATGWNRSAAARLLGIHRKTLYTKIKALGLRRDTLS